MENTQSKGSSMTLEGLHKMKCGGCGNPTASVYKNDRGIILQCCSCRSLTVIQPAPATLKLEWGNDNQKGVFTARWPNEKD